MNARFGDGWMSANAADLVMIAVTLGGFNIAEVLRELPIRERSTINVQSVQNALQRISDRRR